MCIRDSPYPLPHPLPHPHPQSHSQTQTQTQTQTTPLCVYRACVCKLPLNADSTTSDPSPLIASIYAGTAALKSDSAAMHKDIACSVAVGAGIAGEIDGRSAQM
eukprot:2615834-Rhodomonas_salina.1